MAPRTAPRPQLSHEVLTTIGADWIRPIPTLPGPVLEREHIVWLNQVTQNGANVTWRIALDFEEQFHRGLPLLPLLHSWRFSEWTGVGTRPCTLTNQQIEGLLRESFKHEEGFFDWTRYLSVVVTYLHMELESVRREDPNFVGTLRPPRVLLSELLWRTTLPDQDLPEFSENGSPILPASEPAQAPAQVEPLRLDTTRLDPDDGDDGHTSSPDFGLARSAPL